MSRSVGYIVSPSLISCTDALPSNQGRSTLVHSLAWHLGLLEYNHGLSDLFGDQAQDSGAQARIYAPPLATVAQLAAYHTPAFVNSLLSDQASLTSAGGTNQFGLLDDCPRFDGMREHVQLVAGGSILAADLLATGRVDVAIAWDGGRHHASKATASGFCYINDAVLAILALRRPRRDGLRIRRVAYIDLDVHWGDGVQEAFQANKHILTLSIHHAAPGFFPCHHADSGALAPPPSTALNLPLRPGTSRATIQRTMESCVRPVLDAFKPDAIVIQAGLDGLADDPVGVWNLDAAAYVDALRTLLQLNKPTLLLGGGGYHGPNAARVWSLLTAVTLERDLPPTTPVPNQLKSWPSFGPTYTLDVPSGEMSDRNDEAYLQHVETIFAAHAESLRE